METEAEKSEKRKREEKEKKDTNNRMIQKYYVLIFPIALRMAKDFSV